VAWRFRGDPGAEVTESRGGRHDVDVVESAVRSDRAFAATRDSVFAAAYSTGLVAAAQGPQRYEDLLDAKWKGRLGIEADDADWFSAVVGALGEPIGFDLFRTIVARNGISVRKAFAAPRHRRRQRHIGTQRPHAARQSGRVRRGALALTIYTFRAEQLKKSGAPIDWSAIAPTIARFEGAGVARRAAHPNAAILFFEFPLTDGQELLRGREMFTASRNAEPLPAGISVAFLDAATHLDESRKWGKYYRDIIVNQAR
jgi:iron(III) transport system substrate-binding protein